MGLLNHFTAMISLNETTSKNVKSEKNAAFLSSFPNWHVKGLSSKKQSIKSRCVIGPENILFAGASVLSVRKFYSLGQ